MTSDQPFKELLEQIEDSRQAKLVRYPLQEVLFLVLIGTLCGCDKLTMIAVFGEEKLDWFRKYYPYQYGIPSHDTLGRVLGLVDKGQFEQLFSTWVSQHFDLSSEGLLHLDGKHLAGSADHEKKTKKRSKGGCYAEIIVNLYASGAGICLAHRNVSDHMSEVQGALQLLDWFSLQGCTVTGDSNFCRRRIIDKIIKAKANYIFALKGNSYSFYEATKAAFADSGISKRHYQTKQRGHGRLEKRVYQSITIDQLGDDYKAFYTQAKQLIAVCRNRKVVRKNKESTEVHYYVSSLETPLEQIAENIRKHWLIENQLHYVLDVFWGEDASRLRTKNAATNLSLIRKWALNLLKKQKANGSINARQLRCALSDEYRDNVLKNFMMR